MEKVLRILKKIIPKKLFWVLQPIYHYKMALIGALIYRFPSRKMRVIGVTGTKGKSSVVEILASILETAGYKVASQSTVRFKIGNEVRRNLFKMTMPGRFFMQKFLREALDKNCQYAVIEMTSEGTKQFRHKFIDLDALIFTNLAPEHIESHGGYEKYREAKLKIAKALSDSRKKLKFIIANTDDKESSLFLKTALPAQSVPYSLKKADPYKILDNGLEFTFNEETIHSHLRGKFNIYNILAACVTAKEFGVPKDKIRAGVENLKEIPGRAQIIKAEKFELVVDYAHTPDSLRAIYEAFPGKRKICVLGNTGGGRDTWKRPEMGKIADEYCDKIILTNEDPYDENPRKIVDEMINGIKKQKPEIIMDRRIAIKMAIKSASDIGQRERCVVLLTGKGTDPYIMEAGGKKIQWDDATVAKEEIEKAG